MRMRLSCRARARPIYEERRSRLPVPPAYTRIDAQDRSEMSEEELKERPTPPARIDHEFQEPIVEELPQRTPAPLREPIDAAQGDSSENKNGVDH
jgi:hypothetical protein